MIYKIFYQENKERSPRRENTKVMYLDVDAQTELEGRIKTRRLIEEHKNYNVEYIERLSDKHLEYEKTAGVFELTEL
ncbi:RNA polymerase epsilon subunit [Streptococcus halichoeri]|uniref:RNA polymerase epsilon subunit n=1 Tax=Streptococcus halichoeri TaxID=254785 RepID=UPI000DB2335E|nr:RNA polymerase epsilon subunit [Streptococcus halichoeri]PZO94112.1 MAG: hypothetical protein DI617_07320 [Streptococcus pyogenes]